MTKRHPLYNILGLVLIITVIAALACTKKTEQAEPVVSVHELFESKCTQCHTADKPMQLHGTEQSILQLINRMIQKGAKVSDAQAMKIAGFLSSPNLSLFEEKCTGCHEMKKVLAAHKKSEINQDTLKKMKEKGADISEEDEAKIMEFMNNF